MARLSWFCLLGISQHVIQRGNNRQVCFASDEDFSAYSNWLHEYSNKWGQNTVFPNIRKLIGVRVKTKFIYQGRLRLVSRSMSVSSNFHQNK